MIKYVACDLDGTIINAGGECAPSVADTVRKLREHGIRFAICTGRPVDCVLPLLSGWGLEGLVDDLIGNNGGEVLRMDTGERLSFYRLSVDDIKSIIDEYEPLGVIPTMYNGAMFYAQRINDTVARISARVRTRVEQGDIRTLLTEPQYKEMFVVEPEDMTRIEAYEKAHRSSRWLGVRTAPDLFEFSDVRLGKDTGLSAAVRKAGYGREHVMAFGDTTNDLPMIRYAGIGVWMSNGSEDVRAAADRIAGSVDGDGFAGMIREELGL